MNCTNHPEKRAKAHCRHCHMPFCRECLIKEADGFVCIPDYVRAQRAAFDLELADGQAANWDMKTLLGDGGSGSGKAKGRSKKQVFRWWDWGFLTGILLLTIFAFSSRWAGRIALLFLLVGIGGTIVSLLFFASGSAQRRSEGGLAMLRSFTGVGMVALLVAGGVQLYTRPPGNGAGDLNLIADEQVPLADGQALSDGEDFLTDSSEGGDILVDRGPLFVDVTLPASMADSEMTGILTDEERDNGILSKTVNEDGSVTMSFDARDYERLLEEIRGSVSKGLMAFAGSEAYPSIREVQHSRDFKTVTFVVDQQAYESGADSAALLSAGMQAAMFQVFAGVEQNQIKVELQVRDRASGEVFRKVQYPNLQR